MNDDTMRIFSIPNRDGNNAHDWITCDKRLSLPLPCHWLHKAQSKDRCTYMAFHHGAAGKCRIVEDVATLIAVNVVSLNNINNVEGEVKQEKK